MEGDSPCSTPSPKDCEPEVESGEIDPETYGPIPYDPDICSTPSPEDCEPEVESREIDPETYGPITYDPDIYGLVTCGPVVTETGGPELCVTEGCCGLS
jgi:hypothetical protein